MLNSPCWLRPFLVAIVGVLFISSTAIAARDGSTDRPGLDYKTIELSVPNPDLCENACKKDGKCRAWTYSWPGAKGPKAMCALKTGVPPKRSDTCCISGIISTSSPVTRTDSQSPAPQEPPASAKTAPAQQETKPEEKKQQAEPSAPQDPPDETKQSTTTQPSSDQAPAQQAPQPSVTQKQDLPTPPAVQDEQATDTVAVPPKPSQRPAQQDTENLQQEADQPDPTKVAACNNYANRAMAQNQENNRLDCRLSGSLWGYSRDAYYNFCMRNPSSEYNGSRAARDRELDTCKRQAATRRQRDDDDNFFFPNIFGDDADDVVTDNSRTGRFCRNFAGQSVRQVRQARLSKCGFGGERWSSSRVRQARLCARIGPRAATELLNTRNRQIRDCRLAASRRDRPTQSRCREYARTAVRQAREARRLDCGFRGGRWSLSFERHLKWCNQASRNDVRREYRRRDERLEWCR